METRSPYTAAVDDYGQLVATATRDALIADLWPDVAAELSRLRERNAELEAALKATEAERARLALAAGEDDGDAETG